MAKIPAYGTRIWLDEFALHGHLTAADIAIAQEVIPVTTFADAGPRRVVGNHDHSGQYSGLFDAATSGLDQVLAVDGWTDETHYLLEAFETGLEGSQAFLRAVRLTERPIEVKTAQAILLNFSDEGDGAIARGKILRRSAITGTGIGTGREIGATVAGQAFVVDYRVISVSGSGSIELLIRQSTDDAVGDPYATLAGTTATFTAAGVQRFIVTGATEAWKTVVVTAFSGFSSVNVLVVAGNGPLIA